MFQMDVDRARDVWADVLLAVRALVISEKWQVGAGPRRRPNPNKTWLDPESTDAREKKTNRWGEKLTHGFNTCLNESLGALRTSFLPKREHCTHEKWLGVCHQTAYTNNVCYVYMLHVVAKMISIDYVLPEPIVVFVAKEVAEAKQKSTQKASHKYIARKSALKDSEENAQRRTKQMNNDKKKIQTVYKPNPVIEEEKGSVAQAAAPDAVVGGCKEKKVRRRTPAELRAAYETIGAAASGTWLCTM
eukprot:g55549.t1